MVGLVMDGHIDMLVSHLWCRSKLPPGQYIPYCPVARAISRYCPVVQLTTVDREIFVVKKFSWVTPPTKIKRTKNVLQRIIMYTVFLCVCAFCMQLPFVRSSTLTARSSISVVLSSWTVDNVCHTNEMVVYHIASRLIRHHLCRFDHTSRSRSNRRSRADVESDFVGPFRVR